MLLISYHILYTFPLRILSFMFMPTNTLEVDTGEKLYVPEGTITVRDNDLYLYVPKGTIIVQDSDLCIT